MRCTNKSTVGDGLTKIAGLFVVMSCLESSSEDDAFSSSSFLLSRSAVGLFFFCFFLDDLLLCDAVTSFAAAPGEGEAFVAMMVPVSIMLAVSGVGSWLVPLFLVVLADFGVREL